MRSGRDGATHGGQIATRRRRDHEGRQRKAVPVGELEATMSIEQTNPGSVLDDQLRREQAKAIFDLLRSTSRPRPAKGCDR